MCTDWSCCVFAKIRLLAILFFNGEREMMKWLMKRLADDRGLLTMVAGLALLVLGAAKGVTYNAFLPVDDPYGRIALGVVGLALGVRRPAGWFTRDTEF
jgi:hypothetical protein